MLNDETNPTGGTDQPKQTDTAGAANRISSYQRAEQDEQKAAPEQRNSLDSPKPILPRRIWIWLRTWYENPFRLRGNFAEHLTVVVSIVIAVIAGFQYSVYKQQKKILEAGERPWISVDTGQLTGFGFQDDIGAYAAFDLGVSAIGQTPAHRVRALGRLVTRENFTSPALQTRAVCDEAEKTALRDVTVFPSQKNITVRGSAIWGKDFAKSSKAKSVNFVVLGCLAYTDSFDGSHHTGFTFDLYRRDPTHPGLEMPIEIVPFGSTGQIDMTPNWSGFTTFAD